MVQSASVDTQARPHAEVRFPESPRSAALARAFTRRTLTDWGHQGWPDAVQVVSELVTNVLLHAHGGPVVRLTWAPHGVRIEVSDDSPLPPTVPTGLGLSLVARLTTAWGVVRRGGGKVVWCELPAVPAPAPA